MGEGLDHTSFCHQKPAGQHNELQQTCMPALAYKTSLLDWSTQYQFPRQAFHIPYISRILMSLEQTQQHLQLYPFLLPGMEHTTHHLAFEIFLQSLLETSSIPQVFHSCITIVIQTRFIILLFVIMPLRFHLEH